MDNYYPLYEQVKHTISDVNNTKPNQKRDISVLYGGISGGKRRDSNLAQQSEDRVTKGTSVNITDKSCISGQQANLDKEGKQRSPYNCRALDTNYLNTIVENQNVTSRIVDPPNTNLQPTFLLNPPTRTPRWQTIEIRSHNVQQKSAMVIINDPDSSYQQFKDYTQQKLLDLERRLITLAERQQLNNRANRSRQPYNRSAHKMPRAEPIVESKRSRSTVRSSKKHRKRANMEKVYPPDYILGPDDYDENGTTAPVRPKNSKSPRDRYPPQPICLIYDQISSKIYTENRITVVCNFEAKKLKFYIINRYKDSYYLQSKSRVSATCESSRKYSLSYQFCMVDLGSIPYLLVQDDNGVNLLYPLHYAPIHADGEWGQYVTELLDEKLEQEASFIELEGPYVTYSTVSNKFGKIRILDGAENKVIEIDNASEIEVLHPEAVYTNMYDHPVTLRTVRLAQMAGRYQNFLQFDNEFFWNEYGWEAACHADPEKKLQEEPNCYLYLRVRNTLYGLGFDSEGSQEAVHLAIMHAKGVFFCADYVDTGLRKEIVYKQNPEWINTVSKRWVGDYQFDQGALFQVENKTINVGDVLRVTATKNGVEVMVASLRGAETIHHVVLVEGPQLVLPQEMGYSQIQIWGYSRNVVQRILATKYLVQRVIDEKVNQSFMDKQLNSPQTLNAVLTQPNNTSADARIVIYKYQVSVFSDPVVFENKEVSELHYMFGPNNQLSMLYQSMGFELKMQNIQDYYQLCNFLCCQQIGREPE